MSKQSNISPDELELLVEKSRNGDVRAFGKVYDALVMRLYRFIYTKVGNREDAQDIVAETWQSAWLHLPKYKKGNFTAYVFRIAYTTFISFTRRRKSTYSLDEVGHIPSSVSIEEKMMQQEQVDTVFAKLKQLPPLYGEIIMLRYIEGFSVQETAQIVGKPSLLVRVTQHRAIKKLQQLCTV